MTTIQLDAPRRAGPLASAGGAMALASVLLLPPVAGCTEQHDSRPAPRPAPRRVEPPGRFQELPFLDEWTGQATAELLALEGKYRIDSLVMAFEEALQQKMNRVGYDALSAPERAVLAIEAMEREVNNGGYEQFFHNWSRRYAADLVGFLREIGCPVTAEISQRALDALGLDGPVTGESILAALDRGGERLSEELHELDREYYTSGEAIADRLFEHLERHRDAIDIP